MLIITGRQQSAACSVLRLDDHGGGGSAWNSNQRTMRVHDGVENTTKLVTVLEQEQRQPVQISKQVLHFTWKWWLLSRSQPQSLCDSLESVKHLEHRGQRINQQLPRSQISWKSVSIERTKHHCVEAGTLLASLVSCSCWDQFERAVRSTNQKVTGVTGCLSWLQVSAPSL